MRQAGAVALGVVVALLGALILGEYTLGVVGGVAAGVIVGLAVAEAALMAAGARTLETPWSVALAVVAAAALVWAGWIDVHHRDESIRAGAWLGAIAAAAAVALRTRRGSGRSAGSDSPEGSRRTP